jgi:tetratricopeptide (TPR) repeat protein
LAVNNYPVYPYTLRNNFGTTTANVAWRELTLENEYLHCRVFPDLGGHLYSCRDKINNVEIFYANPVIRKGYVGLRGAWIATGIELNFPVGHSLVSVSPVSFGTRQNADGSGSAWVADVDRQTGMEWRVEFVLRPGTAMLEQNVSLYNRGDARQPYYWWSNSEQTEQDQNDTFILPTHVWGTHGFTFFDTWPITQNQVDMSVIRSYGGGFGLFAYGSNEPFIAAYHPATKTGTAHYADPLVMPGKKVWTWGSSGDPYVISNLTENFPSYIETQAGVTPNQETRLWLDPQQSSHFTEYWMPARELDGISRANTSGVLYLGRTTINTQPALAVEFNANLAIAGARIRILNGSSPAAPDAVVNLTPAITYRQTVAGVASNVNYTFQLLDSANNVLMTHTENQYSGLTAADVTLGNQPPPYFGTAGSEQYYLNSAAYDEQYRQYNIAEQAYNNGIALFPTSIALRKGLGRLVFLAARFDDAATLLAQVTALTPNDNEAHFYLGLAYAALGRNNAAASEWTGIQSTADFGRAATFELACLRAVTGDLSNAANLLDAANTVRAGAMEVAVLRRQGNIASASAKLAQWRTVSPTDLFLRYEATLLGTPDSTLANDLGAEPERVLNLADDYLRLGSYGDALTLLSQIYPSNIPDTQREPGALAPQNNALIAYYRGYCRQQLGGSPAADFSAASAMALPYIFPSRTSSFAVLRAALQANANDATAHDLLALLYFNRRQVDNAIVEWQSARSLNKTLPALHRNLGRAYLDIKGDVNAALPVLSEGLNYEPSNSDLRDAYNRANNAKQANTACPFTLTNPASGSVTIGPGATTVSVSFTGSASCNWSSVGYGPWISIASADHGQGPGTVSYAVSANSGLTSRSETLFVGGQPFTITQSGQTCSFSLTSSAASLPTSGGTVTVGVMSPSDACAWSASTTQSWISIISGASGDGGTVTVSAAANSGAARNGVVTIAGQSFTVNEAGTGAVDLALGKAATQSSTLPGYPTDTASGAVDGNTDGQFFHGSVTHTNSDANAWWQVDLGNSAEVSSIAIWNRTDCCMDRLNDYWVFVSDTPFAASDTPTTLRTRAGTWNSHQTAFPNASTTITANAQGRYVRVQLNGTNYLSLAEVQVFGTGSTSTYGISGQVTLAGSPQSGVTVTLSGSQSAFVSTIGSGNYSFTGLAAGGNYAVTPALSGYTFTPSSQTFNNLSASQTANFTAASVTYQITGQVTVSGAGLNGITITLSGSQSGTTTTSGAGNYAFSSLAAAGTYTVTPSLSGYTFTPPSQTFSNLSASQTANFIAAPVTYQITGQVTLSSAGFNGVTMTLSGSQSGAGTTSGSGNFSFTGLAAGGTYTVTPSLSGYSFTPPSQTFSNLSANQIATFTASAAATGSDLAQGKPATQSSTLSGFGPTTVPSSAVDGDTNGNFFHGSVSHTNLEADAWWQVDLGSSANLTSITIWNRTDCCSDRLGNYWVFVSNTPFASTDTPTTLQGRAATWSNHQTVFPNPSTTIAVNAPGRYVRVQLNGSNYLSLAEVQVFGSFATTTYGISGQVTLSGTGFNGVSMALSGAQTGTASTNATGNYGFTGLAAGGTYTVTPSFSGYSFTPPSQTFTNLSANQIANFTATAVTNSNLAQGKAATQSSTLAGFGPTTVPSSAVDGDTNGDFFHGSVSHTNFNANAWWQVDLGASAAVSSITIWNRTDCCMDRLSDYWVFVSDTPFGPTDTPTTLQTRTGTWSNHQTGFPNPSTTITVNAQGRYVRVQLSGTNYLSLAEVQVFGTPGPATKVK